MGMVFCVVPFEIPENISPITYTLKNLFYSEMKIYELLDPKAHMRFGNAPDSHITGVSCSLLKVYQDPYTARLLNWQISN